LTVFGHVHECTGKKVWHYYLLELCTEYDEIVTEDKVLMVVGVCTATLVICDVLPTEGVTILINITVMDVPAPIDFELIIVGFRSCTSHTRVEQ